ncbi:MAG: 4-alpha-glucanotransferase [Cellulosilyticaceae bacterium]
MKRGSGIIMHISSLANQYGIGNLGKSAYEFADFLHKSGQKYWQILPLGHTGYGDSPYQCFSAFAGNPYFIDFDKLIVEGLLDIKDIQEISAKSNLEKVDYGFLFEHTFDILKIAYKQSSLVFTTELEVFKKDNEAWIGDYALYMAIKEKMGRKHWKDWEIEIKLRNPEVLGRYKEELEDEIGYWTFVQYEFFKQWHELKAYVNSLGIGIIGDLPIYVAGDSADAWANSELFQLDREKNPIVVAGCPPDAFSETGQLWGNPIYDWESMKKNNYSWWVSRIQESLKLYDIIRIDHFRGFEAYWAIPYKEKTAMNGKWIKGPGIKLFKAIEEVLGKVAIIAEDLGFLTQEVLDLKAETGYPGMKVLQFAFGGEENNYMPHTYQKECIVYTGTHDNDTVMGWMNTTGDQEAIKEAIDYLGLNEKEGINWGVIRGAWASVGEVALAPMQDFLGLGNEARMNYPSTLGGNWMWRIEKESLTDELAKKIYKITRRYGRCNKSMAVPEKRV